MQVRVLPPQLDYKWKSSGRMRNLPRKQVRAKCPLWVRVPRLPPQTVNVPLADRQRHQPSKLNRRVRFPQGTLDRVGSSAADRRRRMECHCVAVFVKHPRVGSSPTRPSPTAG